MAKESEKHEDQHLVKELSRRRVYIFLALFTALAFGGLLREESDQFLHVLDEYVLVGGSLVILFLSWKWRATHSLAALKSQHVIFTMLLMVMLIFQIAALSLEISDPADFGNDIPSLILVIVTILNKFIP